jgi:acetyl/propionyl-CoA carboxylase alpha subunit
VAPPFRRVLVANRGEIAVRLIRACHELGIEAVAVFSEADAGALHVRKADRAVAIGPAPPRESYLRVDALIDAAVRTGCEALHPGYGFLSEQAGLARACADAGIVFVGPEPDTLELLGDKLAARRLAREAGVPVVPGTLEAAPLARPDQLEAIVAAAQELGFPLLVKAAAGGGGRGMREVPEPRGLPEALASASHEAEAAFGDGSVYFEHIIRPARHVEVQLLGDAETVVALGERDCSVQRRHQKLVEEAPAPGVASEKRRELHGYAVALGRAARLRSAATAEFLLDPDGRFWFHEVNARLQVEHGVTELVTGVDLVHEQLRIAAGGSISAGAMAAADRAAEPNGHALEVRLTAEDPGNDFRPSPGRLTRWWEPGGPGIRVDSGVEAGSVVPPAYDSLMAKILAWGPERAVAMARLRRALDELEVGGVQTSLPFLRHVAADPIFADGAVDTGYVERSWDPGPLRASAETHAMLAAALLTWSSEGAPESVLPWAAPATQGPATPAEPERPWRLEGRREAVDRWP